jgi:MbtH protein
MFRKQSEPFTVEFGPERRIISCGESEMPADQEDKTIYKVVVNHEEQYSIWPAHRENALGWKDAGKSGTKEECLAYIKEVWTDMRPLSLRKKMQEQGLS